MQGKGEEQTFTVKQLQREEMSSIGSRQASVLQYTGFKPGVDGACHPKSALEWYLPPPTTHKCEIFDGKAESASTKC